MGISSDGGLMNEYECKNEADSWECERCIWGDKSDRYEPKEEPTCTQD